MSFDTVSGHAADLLCKACGSHNIVCTRLRRCKGSEQAREDIELEGENHDHRDDDHHNCLDTPRVKTGEETAPIEYHRKRARQDDGADKEHGKSFGGRGEDRRQTA